MRKFKFIPVILGCLAAMCLTFTSCDDDDDDNVPSLTPQERQTAFAAVAGNYSGKMIYPKYNANGTQAGNDSIDIAWSITNDSTMTIYNMPAQPLASNITDTTVRKALLDQHPVNIECRISFIRVTPSTFIINPVSPNFSVTYGGKEHKITLPFYVNTYYSYGTSTAASRVQMQIILGGVYEDGKYQQKWLTQAVPYLLNGTKH